MTQIIVDVKIVLLISLCISILLRLTALVKERNSETHSEGNQNTPVKTLAFSREYVRDKLIQQILGWLSQKCLDVKVCLVSELLPWCFYICGVFTAVLYPM